MSAEHFDESGYRALHPIPLDQMTVGTRVLVPHWDAGHITTYDLATITHADPKDAEGYVLCDNGQGYYRYSLATPPLPLFLRMTVTVMVDRQDYAEAFGLDGAHVEADAKGYVVDTLGEVMDEQAKRIAAGITVGDIKIASGDELPVWTLPRYLAEEWAGRKLDGDAFDRLEEAIPNSSIPQAIEAIVDGMDLDNDDTDESEIL